MVGIILYVWEHLTHQQADLLFFFYQVRESEGEREGRREEERKWW